MFNVSYYDENGERHFYLAVNVTEKTAVEYCEAFNRRYRKPYPNGKGYYATAKVVEILD